MRAASPEELLDAREELEKPRRGYPQGVLKPKHPIRSKTPISELTELKSGMLGNSLFHPSPDAGDRPLALGDISGKRRTRMVSQKNKVGIFEDNPLLAFAGPHDIPVAGATVWPAYTSRGWRDRDHRVVFYNSTRRGDGGTH